MADVINRITLQYLQSVNTPDFPTKDWIINPVLPKCDQKYWKIVGDLVKEMTTIEKAAVDQAEANVLAQIEADAKDITKADDLLKSLTLVVGDFHSRTESQMKDLVEAKIG